MIMQVEFHCKWCKQTFVIEWQYTEPTQEDFAKVIHKTRVLHFQKNHIVKDKEKNGSKK